MKQITENVYAADNYAGDNPAYVKTAEGIVIIDPPQMPSVAVELLDIVKSQGPLKWLINTEHHPDHTFGNYYFNNMAPVVAHRELYSRFMTAPGLDCYHKNLDETKVNDPEGLKYYPEENEYWQNCNRPNVLFDDYLKITVGEHDFECYHTGGHTIDQICVYCPQERVLFPGDTIFSQVQIFFAEADPFIILEALDFIEQFDAQYIVPGHGAICTKDAINENRAFVLDWISAVQNGIAKGWSKDECMEHISFADRYPIDVGLDAVLHDLQKGNSGKLYDYLTSKGRGRGYTLTP